MLFKAAGGNNSRLAKIIVGGATLLTGMALGCAFGVQMSLQKLGDLASPLGEELRKLERLRMQLRKRGAMDDSSFSGDSVDAERERLGRKTRLSDSFILIAPSVGIFNNRVRNADHLNK